MPVNLERDCYEIDGSNALKRTSNVLRPQLRLVPTSGGEEPPLIANIISLTEFKAKKAEQELNLKRNTLLPSKAFLQNLKQEVSILSSTVKETEIEPAQPETPIKQPEKLHTAHEVEGQLFVFDASLYRNLYDEYMKFSGGDREIARRNVLLAIIKDGAALIQENIAALKEKDKFGKEKRIVDDDVIQAQMQYTPTEHRFYETIDPETGERILCSPEHLELRKSYLKTITRFRRGNDLAINGLMQNLALNQPVNDKSVSALSKSPRAEGWEGPLVNQCAGEYGYAYTWNVTEEAGLRMAIVYSVKVDANTETFLRVMDNVKGKSYQASFDDIDPTNPYSPSKERPLDIGMRTGKILDEHLSVEQWISAIYKAKGEVEGVEAEGPNKGHVTMFGIKEKTMLDVQSPELRKRIEQEPATIVAHWVLSQIEKGVSNEEIQSQVRNKYIKEVKAFVSKVQKERERANTLSNYPIQTRRNYDGTTPSPYNSMSASSISAAEMALRADLRNMVQTKGAFCGIWGESSPSFSFGISSDSLADLSNSTGLSGTRVNVLGGGGLRLSSGEVTHCKKCGDHLCGTGKCGKCNIKYN